MLHAGPRACVSYVSLCALSGLCMFSCHANYIFCHRCSTQVCATSCPSLWRRNVKYHLHNGVARSWLASMLVLPPLGDDRWRDPWGRCDIVGCWSHWIAMWTLLRQRAAAPLWLLARNPKGIAIAWQNIMEAIAKYAYPDYEAVVRDVWAWQSCLEALHVP
jgi:hypothetical protein